MFFPFPHPILQLNLLPDFPLHPGDCSFFSFAMKYLLLICKHLNMANILLCWEISRKVKSKCFFSMINKKY